MSIHKYSVTKNSKVIMKKKKIRRNFFSKFFLDENESLLQLLEILFSYTTEKNSLNMIIMGLYLFNC